MSEWEKRCFVIQRFDGKKFDKRYEDVFKPAVLASGLEPYRVDHDPSTEVPIDSIERGIEQAAIVLADISTDRPNVWYEVGYAFANQKPVCLVCWPDRGTTGFPFDIQHRALLLLNDDSLSDYEIAKKRIEEKLRSLLENRAQLSVVASIPSVQVTDGLAPHEIAVLVHCVGELDGVIGEYSLRRGMEQFGFSRQAVGVGVMSLQTRNFVSLSISEPDHNGETEKQVVVSDLGRRWLVANQHHLSLHATPKSTLIRRDDSIPF
jgi:hypothetical protein